jgi:hypothetical protein
LYVYEMTMLSILLMMLSAKAQKKLLVN